MSGINLLPWREAARKKSQQNFVMSVVGAVAVGAVLVGAGYTYMEGRISYQEERNAYLETEIKQLDKALEEIKTLDANRKALLDRIAVIERLQSTRPGIVHLFDEMVNSLPKGLYLTELKQDKNKIKLIGKAESSARVSSYMNRLNSSPWLKSSDLNTIEVDTKNKDGNNNLRYFSLNVTQLLTSGNDEENDNGY
ncbi:MAG: PilN domain-containing protein [Cocleimonas sp.]|nr:PilN domain-containing protein [Cocleimonas sp.]